MTAVATKTRVEYKMEPMPYHEDEVTHTNEFLDRLNELGKDGWQLVDLNPLKRATGGWEPSRPIPMLLMRVISD
jgi:hypothetical protein